MQTATVNVIASHGPSVPESIKAFGAEIGKLPIGSRIEHFQVFGEFTNPIGALSMPSPRPVYTCWVIAICLVPVPVADNNLVATP
jgi:hypothetical protein